MFKHNAPTKCPNCGKSGVRRSTVPAGSVAYGNAYYIWRCRYCKHWTDEAPAA